MRYRMYGWALLLGGIALLIANGVFSPILPIEASFAELAGSQVFLWRLSLAAGGLILLMLGFVGLHLRQAAKAGWFGAFAFALAFIGTAALMAHEWAQVFFIHHIAKTVPTALDAMEDVAGPNLFDAEAIIAVIGFSLGWLVFCVSMLIARVHSWPGPVLVIAGLIGAPLFGAGAAALNLSPALGMIVGGVLFALGWIWLARDLLKAGPTD